MNDLLRQDVQLNQIIKVIMSKSDSLVCLIPKFQIKLDHV